MNMQATVSDQATSEPFFQQTIGGRPFGLWCIWLMGTFAWLFLFFGLLIDEIGYSEYFITGSGNNDNNDKFQCTCGYATFNCLGSGFQDEKYTTFDDEAVVIVQIQAGNGWLAFLILAMIFSPLCCFGFGKDYMEGEYDSIKPSDFWDGCPGVCQACGFSSYGMIIISVWSFIGLLWYVFGEKCSDEEFWDVFNNDISELTTIGGITMVLTIMAIILFSGALGLVFYMVRAFGAVPSGERKESPIKFQKEAVGDVPQQKPKSEPIPAAAPPTGLPPSSSIFNPSNNITSTGNTNTNTNTWNSNKSNSNKTSNKTNPWKKQANMGGGSKPKGPPPVPSKPKGPPPVPR